ncbi:acylphosphatase-1-like isoform X2 [Phymastichus coffea]|uniref:acylphosphatase-1-like isoform X2 n=1 Tax=Phymastichus coffea TaxID=108790 RepID=UPI00273B5E9C|nr:acylphosphatase-1-like isoform X2 [Phymastichus coffea]XP_058809663.1 acylphosphatase-1-like isoform X2 [Phymastichus coffea]
MLVIDIFKNFHVHSFLIIIFLMLVREFCTPDEMPAIVGVDFEVYGRVQGVFFRKYTKEKAKELKLNGWCMNTKQGTVLGYVEGEQCKVNELKTWLQRKGSPESAIDKVEFRNEKELEAPTLDKFTIKK